MQILITLGALCCVATLLTTWMGSAASYLSYPGGIALHELHNIGCPKQTCEVHVGTLAARTGVSPFGESTDAETWAYSKEEGLSAWDLEV